MLNVLFLSYKNIFVGRTHTYVSYLLVRFILETDLNSLARLDYRSRLRA